MEDRCVYFETIETRAENTAQCLQIVKEVCDRDGIEHVIVASNTGRTAAQFARGLDLERVNLVGIKMAASRDAVYKIEPDEQAYAYLKQAGVPLVGGVHALTGGVPTAVAAKFQGAPPSVLIAHTLYMFCQGMKVAVEVACMACDHGFVPTGVQALACGGNSSGANTVILLKTGGSAELFDVKILKILAKPLQD